MLTCVMVAPRPTLLPLLRSENQLRLLTTLLLDPARAFMVKDLAEQTGVPQPSVSREIAHLLGAGILSATKERGRRVVSANTESPIFPELASLVLKTAGPKTVLERGLAGVGGIARALIYGSWARRYAGEPGAAPADIDLMVIGAPDVREIRQRADRAGHELGRDVNVSVLTLAEWDVGASGFLEQVKRSPVVELDLRTLAVDRGGPACR
jgi:DNA-binding transcriptional ArsR family regulator